MPWRRKEVAPYSYDDVYEASNEEKFYYSYHQRTPEEREKIEKEKNDAHQEGKRQAAERYRRNNGLRR